MLGGSRSTPDTRKILIILIRYQRGVGDLAHLILAFCNTQGIDFEEAFLEMIKKRHDKHKLGILEIDAVDIEKIFILMLKLCQYWFTRSYIWKD